MFRYGRGCITRFKALAKALVAINFERNDIDFERGCFRIKGDTVEIFPSSTFEKALRIEFFGDDIERISEIEVVTGRRTLDLKHIAVFPGNALMRSVVSRLSGESVRLSRILKRRLNIFRTMASCWKPRGLHNGTKYDIEMMREIGYCTGIENYSRYFDGRTAGEPPFTLLDYFPDDFLMVIDESHVTLPQVRAMYKGDFSRKDNLVKYGFRLPGGL